MKKIFAVLLMLTLCSCGSNAAPAELQAEPTTTVAITEAEPTTEQATEPATTATEIPPAPTTEPPTEPETNELLFEDQDYKIYYQGIEQNIIKLYLENYSESYDLHIFLQNIKVNGQPLENVRCENYVDKNRKEFSWPCAIPLEELQSMEITRINELKFTIYMYAGNWQFETEEFTITR